MTRQRTVTSACAIFPTPGLRRRTSKPGTCGTSAFPIRPQPRWPTRWPGRARSAIPTRPAWQGATGSASSTSGCATPGGSRQPPARFTARRRDVARDVACLRARPTRLGQGGARRAQGGRRDGGRPTRGGGDRRPADCNRSTWASSPSCCRGPGSTTRRGPSRRGLHRARGQR